MSSRLHPAIPSVHVLKTHFQFAAASIRQVPDALQECVVIICAGNETGVISICYDDVKSSSRTLNSHLHTNTSLGLRVLGVMIHGDTWNMTVSVKMGVSGQPCLNTNIIDIYRKEEVFESKTVL